MDLSADVQELVKVGPAKKDMREILPHVVASFQRDKQKQKSGKRFETVADLIKFFRKGGYLTLR